VQARVIGTNALWVHSKLVIEAKTPEQIEHELREAVMRTWPVEGEQPAAGREWRRHWNEITGMA
jgi:hypothetical protein